LVTSNPDLIAERGINADIGLTWKHDKTLELTSAAFISQRRDLIATVFDTRGVGHPLNIGAARIVGLEFSGDWQVNQRWSLRINSTVQRARVRSNDAALNDKQIPGEPIFSSYLRLQHKGKRVASWFESESANGRFYDTANSLPAVDQWLLHLGFDWRIAPASIGLRFNNISDQSVEDFNGFPRPGRSVFLQMTVNL